VGPVLTWLAFAAHEPTCVEAEAFWLGDLPTSDGEVEGVILGSSQAGLGFDVYALDAATGHPWVRVARHAIEQSSVPRTFPRMLASTAASPGLQHLVVETSPYLFDQVSCGRPELEGVPLRASWWSAAREMLGPDAELAPDVAMGWLPHRWLMTSGRRRDLVTHVKNPREGLQVLLDSPRMLHGFSPPSRWVGEPVPDLTEERMMNRRKFLLGAPLDRYVPEVNAECVAILETLVRVARPGRTVFVMPPVRAAMRDSIPADYRAALRAALEGVAQRAATPVVVYDATSEFEGMESESFMDFDHLSAGGAAELTGRVAERLVRP
jgi:hypothetical protein